MENTVEQNLNFLGLRVRDKVTKVEGIVTSVTFDLYGCVQSLISPPVKDGEHQGSRWYDIARLEVIDAKPVMDVPDFNKEKGPAYKPRTDIGKSYAER